MAPGIVAREVGWSGRPWCCSAGTVRLPGFRRKHHGAHVCPPSSTTPQRQGQRHRHRHVCLVTACIMFDYVDNPDATVFSSPTCLGRPMLQGASGHTAPGCGSTRRPSSLARRTFTRFRYLARGPSSVQCRCEDAEPDSSYRRRLRPGAPVVRPHVCVGGLTVSADGHHGLSCRHGSGRYSRHNQVNDLLCRAFISADTLATREPHSLCISSGKRPDGVTQVPWRRGRCLAWDVTCPDTYAMSHIQASSTQAGLAAAAAEAKKKQKYADIISGVDFVPVAIETSGVWGEQAIELVMEIGRRIAASTHEPRSTVNLIPPTAPVSSGPARQRLLCAGDTSHTVCMLIFDICQLIDISADLH